MPLPLSARGILVVAAALSACSSQTGQTAASPSSSVANDAIDRLDAAVEVVKQFRDKIPDLVAKDTRCVVIVPSLVRGGLIVGAQSGKGFATCRTETGWSPAAPISTSGGTLGAQIGVQTTDLMMLVMTNRGRASLLADHLRVGADVSAVAGPVGSAESTDFKPDGDIVSYTKSEGLFAGATVSGVTLERDSDATRGIYGTLPELRTILDGQVQPPAVPAAERFVTTVRTAFGVNANVSETGVSPRRSSL
jgi:lipid-binding SYLF domain-containing protein